MRPIVALRMLLPAMLASCTAASEPVAEREDDPALSAALNEAILVDLDLVALNRANSVAAMPSGDGALPTIDDSRAATAAAQAEALQLVGGPGKMLQAPDAAPPGPASAQSRDAPGLRPDCVAGLNYTALWAARMPAPFPVYPHAAVVEAAGTDAADCALRVIVFVTPVPADEVMDFYFTRARAAGFSARYSRSEEGAMLSGARGAAIYEVGARRLPSGNTEVDLLASG